MLTGLNWWFHADDCEGLNSLDNSLIISRLAGFDAVDDGEDLARCEIERPENGGPKTDSRPRSPTLPVKRAHSRTSRHALVPVPRPRWHPTAANERTCHTLAARSTAVGRTRRISSERCGTHLSEFDYTLR